MDIHISKVIRRLQCFGKPTSVLLKEKFLLAGTDAGNINVWSLESTQEWPSSRSDHFHPIHEGHDAVIVKLIENAHEYKRPQTILFQSIDSNSNVIHWVVCLY